jgi:ferredoxin
VTTYKIVIDRGLCSGFGACAELAPDLVEIARDGVAEARVGSSDDERVLEVAASCPMAAIAIFEVATGRQAA